MSVQLQADPVGVEPEFVQYEVVDQVATIWFNRPEVKNCVNWGLLTQFGAALERAERDPDVRACWSARARARRGRAARARRGGRGSMDK